VHISVNCTAHFYIGAAFDPERPLQEYDIYVSIKHLDGERVLVDRMYVCKATGRSRSADKPAKTKRKRRK